LGGEVHSVILLFFLNGGESYNNGGHRQSQSVKSTAGNFNLITCSMLRNKPSFKDYRKNQIEIDPLANFRHGHNSNCHYHLLLVNEKIN
jgi:hypothetical protein